MALNNVGEHDIIAHVGVFIVYELLHQQVDVRSGDVEPEIHTEALFELCYSDMIHQMTGVLVFGRIIEKWLDLLGHST